jgi:hypothetical protein
VRGAVEQRERGVAVELDVGGHARCSYQRPSIRSRKTTALRPPSSTSSK